MTDDRSAQHNPELLDMIGRDILPFDREKEETERNKLQSFFDQQKKEIKREEIEIERLKAVLKRMKADRKRVKAELMRLTTVIEEYDNVPF